MRKLLAGVAVLVLATCSQAQVWTARDPLFRGEVVKTLRDLRLMVLTAAQNRAFLEAAVEIRSAGEARDKSIAALETTSGLADLQQAAMSGRMSADQQAQFKNITTQLDAIGTAYERAVDAALIKAFSSLTLTQRIQIAGYQEAYRRSKESADKFCSLGDKDRNQAFPLLFGGGGISSGTISLSLSVATDGRSTTNNQAQEVRIVGASGEPGMNFDETWKQRRDPGFADKLTMQIFTNQVGENQFMKDLKKVLRNLLERRSAVASLQKVVGPQG